MKEIPGTVQNLRVETDDGTSVSYFDEIQNADGYCLYFYKAEDPSKCIKKRYADKSGKTVRGFKNGAGYLVSVSAFVRSDEGKEMFGPESDKIPFVTMSEGLKAQKKICLRIGETAQIEYEYRNTKPQVVFESTNPQVCRVDNTGNIIALEKGEAYIVTAMDEDNFALTGVSVERGTQDKRLISGTIAFTGDLMCTYRHQKRAAVRNFDFNPELEPIKNRLGFADCLVGVLETVTDDASPYEYEEERLPGGAPNCNSPSAFIPALKNAGFDVLITANNHNCDAGIEGLKSTVTHIRNNGMLNSGTFYDNPIYLNAGGIRVALISLCMINNGLEKAADPDPRRRSIGRYSRELFQEMMDIAGTDSPDYTIVYMHWGNMNSRSVSEAQREEARYIANAGADLIIGSHPHLIQECETIETEDGRQVLCAYSLGNFITMMSEIKGNRDGVALIARLTKKAGEGISVRFSYIPFYNDFNKTQYKVFPIDTSNIPVHKRSRDRIRESLGDTILPEKPRIICAGSDNLMKIIEKAPFCRTDVFFRECTLKSFMEQSRNTAFDSNDYLLVDLYADALDPEFDPSIIMPEFVDYVKSRFGSSHIILLRLGFDIRSVVRNQLRWGVDRNAFNEKIDFLEQIFIELVSPIVIDVADYYLTDVSDLRGKESAILEPDFYRHARRLLKQIIYGSYRTYYFEPDEDIWIKRILKYYDNMCARKFFSWFVDDSYAGRLITYTSQGFVSQFQSDIKKLHELRINNEEDLEYADVSGSIIDALRIIDTVNSGQLLESDNDLRLMYEYGFNLCEAYAGLLTDVLDYPVSKAEIPYAQKFTDNREEYISKYAHKKYNVDIWGSCISRTSIARDEDIVVANYVFKQPEILAFNPPMEVELSDDMSLYENNRWRFNMLKGSFAHNGVERLTKRGTGWIVVDLYDLICEVLKIGDDYLELDDFIKRTYVYDQLNGAGYRSYLFDEVYDADAEEQFIRFTDFIKEKYGANIILVRIDLKDEYLDLDGNMQPLKADPLFKEKREYLTRFEDMFIERTGCHVIDIAQFYSASDAFPLGGAHIVHYEDAFYEECCERIRDVLEKKKSYKITVEPVDKSEVIAETPEEEVTVSEPDATVASEEAISNPDAAEAEPEEAPSQIMGTETSAEDAVSDGEKAPSQINAPENPAEDGVPDLEKDSSQITGTETSVEDESTYLDISDEDDFDIPDDTDENIKAEPAVTEDSVNAEPDAVIEESAAVDPVNAIEDSVETGSADTTEDNEAPTA